MLDIFDYPVYPEMPFLEELAEELEGTFHVIAHACHESDIVFIKERQRYFEEKYSKLLDYVISDMGDFHIIPAYYILQGLLDNDPTPEYIIQICEECLVEHLIGDWNEDYAEKFREFYEQNEEEEIITN